jgi:hypothetical protein
MKPGRYDITIYQRATFELEVTLPIDLTGHTVLAQVWDDKRRRKYADMDVEYIDRVGGEIKLTIDSDVTKVINKQGEWDLMVIYSDDSKQYWLEGDVAIDPGYTDEPE